VPTPLGPLCSLMVRLPSFLKEWYDSAVVLISGLTAQQAMGCVVVGAMITGILSVVSGKFFLM
jgi:cytosine/uracil/thiamine/allantoin permease